MTQMDISSSPTRDNDEESEERPEDEEDLLVDVVQVHEANGIKSGSGSANAGPVEVAWKSNLQ